jgi:hypothetical protein
VQSIPNEIPNFTVTSIKEKPMPDKQDTATSVAWEAPGGLIMVLTRLEDDEASVLTVALDGGAVTVSGKKCRYAMTDGDRERKGKKPSSIQSLSEFRFTIPLARCQIVWKFVETPEPEPELPRA